MHVITKDDSTSAFRRLGKNGNFSEVRYRLPEENTMEKTVQGPAAGREKFRAVEYKRVNDEAMQVRVRERRASELFDYERVAPKHAGQNTPPAPDPPLPSLAAETERRVRAE